MQTNGIIEETKFELEREFTARPLAHKGFNKHFVNLVSADVFKPRRKGFFAFVKDLFTCSK